MSNSIGSDTFLLPDPAGHARAPVGEPSSHDYFNVAKVDLPIAHYVRMKQLFESFKEGETPAFFKKAGVDACVRLKTIGGESFPDGTKWTDLTLLASNRRGNIFEIILTEGRKSPSQPITRTLAVRGGGILSQQDVDTVAQKLETALVSG